jgi:hypothetical protein
LGPIEAAADLAEGAGVMERYKQESSSQPRRGVAARPAEGELTIFNLCVCLIFASVLVAGCAASRMPETGFGEPQALERAVMRYYETHASEENRTCLMPYMEGLTQVDVVEEQPERLVVDVRYLYRDAARTTAAMALPGSAPTTASAASRSARVPRGSRCSI